MLFSIALNIGICFGKEHTYLAKSTITMACSKQFYLDLKADAYPMFKPQRGLALIINNKYYVGFQRREGTDKDRDGLASLWRKLHFNVIIENDLSADGIKEKVQEFSNDESQAMILCILAHGTKRDTIIGIDGKEIPIDTILEVFCANKCQGLIGKPKLFFFQACRGTQRETLQHIERVQCQLCIMQYL